MKKRKEELDVDFIGGEGALTFEEEKALSAYFQQKKSAKMALGAKKTRKKYLNPRRQALQDDLGQRLSLAEGVPSISYFKPRHRLFHFSRLGRAVPGVGG